MPPAAFISFVSFPFVDFVDHGVREKGDVQLVGTLLSICKMAFQLSREKEREKKMQQLID
jgi:hypothetical protein